MAFWSTKKPSATWVDAAFLAIDLELSGLDVRHDCILSVGWCPIDDSGVPLGKRNIFILKMGELNPQRLAFTKSLKKCWMHKG